MARTLKPEFPDGVFFVALGSVRDPSLVLSTIAATLSVKEVAGRPLAELLRDRLDGQRTSSSSTTSSTSFRPRTS